MYFFVPCWLTSSSSPRSEDDFILLYERGRERVSAKTLCFFAFSSSTSSFANCEHSLGWPRIHCHGRHTSDCGHDDIVVWENMSWHRGERVRQHISRVNDCVREVHSGKREQAASMNQSRAANRDGTRMESLLRLLFTSYLKHRAVSSNVFLSPTKIFAAAPLPNEYLSRRKRKRGSPGSWAPRSYLRHANANCQNARGIYPFTISLWAVSLYRSRCTSHR